MIPIPIAGKDITVTIDSELQGLRGIFNAK